MRTAPRAIARRSTLQMMILDRATKLFGSRGARDDDGAVLRAPDVGLPSDVADDSLETPKVFGSVKTGLAGCYHRISGRRTAASISSCALGSSMIDPDAAEDASHASCSSPVTAACLRVFTAVPASVTALDSTA